MWTVCAETSGLTAGARNVEDGQKKHRKKAPGRPRKSKTDDDAKPKRKKRSSSAPADDPETGSTEKAGVRGRKRRKDADGDKEKDGGHRKKRKKTAVSSPTPEVTVVKEEDRNEPAKAKKTGRRKEAGKASVVEVPSSPPEAAVPAHAGDDTPRAGKRRRKAKEKSATSPATKSL